MFIINIYLRFVLIAILLIGGSVLASLYGFWYSFPFILAGVILLVGYIIMGTVQSAAQLVQKTDFVGAEKRLGLTLSPKLMYKANRAYFYLIKGILRMNQNDHTEGERYMRMAQETGLAGENEQAMVHLQLANMSASKGNWPQAKNHFRNIKDLNVTEPQLREQIDQFEKALKNRGVMGAGNQGRHFRPGGKRKRPKLR